MVIVLVTLLLPHLAVSVYVVVEAGETFAEPGVATPPTSGFTSTASAFVTAPHCKVVELPAVIVVAVAPKEATTGAPLHPEGAGVCVTVAAGGGAPGTVILTETTCPNNAAVELRIRQEPV